MAVRVKTARRRRTPRRNKVTTFFRRGRFDDGSLGLDAVCYGVRMTEVLLLGKRSDTRLSRGKA